jgi:hypothetical protein
MSTRGRIRGSEASALSKASNSDSLQIRIPGVRLDGAIEASRWQWLEGATSHGYRW